MMKELRECLSHIEDGPLQTMQYVPIDNKYMHSLCHYLGKKSSVNIVNMI